MNRLIKITLLVLIFTGILSFAGMASAKGSTTRGTSTQRIVEGQSPSTTPSGLYKLTASPIENAPSVTPSSIKPTVTQSVAAIEVTSTPVSLPPIPAAAPAKAVPAPPVVVTASTNNQAAAASLSIHVGPAAVQLAVNYALAQVGKRYVFAASGPNAFDCSGLTAAAYEQAGINLPHFAASQYNYGTHVDVNSLQPGDLLFYYRPIDHVAIYVGNGVMVSAVDPAEGVRIVTVSSQMGIYTGATRLV